MKIIASIFLISVVMLSSVFSHAVAVAGNDVECITDPNDMNFQEMNNINFSQGSVSDVKKIYEKLVVNNEFLTQRSGNPVYFMFDARPWNMSSSPIISYECERLFCLKKDFYNAINICTKKIGSLCQPLAATSGGKNFCFLSPEEKEDNTKFMPFAREYN